MSPIELSWTAKNAQQYLKGSHMWKLTKIRGLYQDRNPLETMLQLQMNVTILGRFGTEDKPTWNHCKFLNQTQVRLLAIFVVAWITMWRDLTNVS